MIDHGKQNILGVLVDAVDYDATVTRIFAAALANQPLAASALAVHGVMTGVFDREQRYRLNQLDVVVPDGQPVRWALNLLHGARLADRVYGPTLMLKLCERAAQEQIPICLFGGTSRLLQALRQRLVDRFPTLCIVGAIPSKFRHLQPHEKDHLAQEIRATGARMTFVGLGCPRQEVWAYEFREAIGHPLIAVGAAFNFHAGEQPQAPAWMQRCGLEWLHRLASEPRRLWRRYLLLNPTYATLCALQIARLKRFDPAHADRPTAEQLYG